MVLYFAAIGVYRGAFLGPDDARESLPLDCGFDGREGPDTEPLRPNRDMRLVELDFFFILLEVGLEIGSVTGSGGGGTFLKNSARLSSLIGGGLEDGYISSSSSSEKSMA